MNEVEWNLGGTDRIFTINSGILLKSAISGVQISNQFKNVGFFRRDVEQYTQFGQKSWVKRTFNKNSYNYESNKW